jgi:hypothetical protein
LLARLVLIDISELECVDQRLEPIGHGPCRVWVDDEDRVHLAVSAVTVTVLAH